MPGKKVKVEVAVDKINNTQRAALAAVIKKVQKDVENARGKCSWEYEVRNKIQKIMERDPVIVQLDLTISDLKRQLAEAEGRRVALVGRYGPPTDPDALVRYNKLMEEESTVVPDAVAECSNAILNIWTASTLSEAKEIADCIVAKYGTSVNQ